MEVNVTFTVLSTCPQLPTTCSSCTASPLNAPSNNQGWRLQFTTSSTDSYGGMDVFDLPTNFGSTISGKTSWTIDGFDVNNCIKVNYISFTTTDPPSNNRNAHYWMGSVAKRDTPTQSKRCLITIPLWNNYYHSYYGSMYGPCPTSGSSTLALGSQFSVPLQGSGAGLDKRTSYYLYWVDIEAQPGSSNSISAYGNGISFSGQVSHSQALATAYL